ncbi:DUF4389 domain-containing protein [Arthrobacter sp. PM3]|uniref:DUF4389 domain-containing protein n=1 Tax=Arthrobacter sp. PM3 TaxID=2017685 RepID=UPI000E100DB7|nr:DUF4389 domain-containing protein [Arthrobacter sp. PM3]AXJ09182.1 DUF4389 domain-containing protein [Arthrobacter sp. PM3]
MKAGRIVMLVIGALCALLGLGLLAGAGFAGWANYQQRDGRYFITQSVPLSADSYALTSPRLDVMTGGGLPEGTSVELAGSVLLRGSTTDPGKQIFIGIAPRADVAAYMAGVRHTEVVDVRFDPFRTIYRDVAGFKPPEDPAQQSFWAATASGPGEQELTWNVRSGTWAVVVMNADASAPVAVNLQAGARTDLLGPVFVGLLIGGIVMLLIGVPLIVLGAVGLGRAAGHGRGGPGGVPPGTGPVQLASAAAPGFAGAAAGPAAPPGPPYPVPPVPPTPYVYPARLNGYLDPNLSRWMWLVKWFLAIPHCVILFFLWFAFGVVTLVAWFAILFTGRYPRSLFDFSVGVIRWNWRVAFYAFTAIGTDRYPPFTLARTNYPADFDVDYPERLSRGLIFVKSWLLAIPHLLVIGLLTGTARSWEFRDGRWVQEGLGISLLGLLVFIAGVILLFTGQYRRGLFDLLLGLNRWIYRVIAYVSLMRDEYPPFHLDMGPVDPGDMPGPALAGPAVGPYPGAAAGPAAAAPYLPPGPASYPPPGPAPYPPQGPGPAPSQGPPPGSGAPEGFYGIGGPAASVGPESQDGPKPPAEPGDAGPKG